MLGEQERSAIAELWTRKLSQDAAGLPLRERHRNLEPDAAEFIHGLAIALGAKRLLEIGGSSGLSTVALGAAARETGGRLTSIEIDPARHAESKARLARLGLDRFVECVWADAGDVIAGLGAMDFVFIDCEKDDYARFFDLLTLEPGAVVAADNILSHHLHDYVAHARRRAPSITLNIGKGLEVTAMPPART